ncbi:hypothetical protein PQI07_11480 [Methylobacterium sp. 092160098-2]|uniref:hypothetical protein n=1 Tax=Methylobacterium sp. 092160098-2 TaxID=3025129 RepID=UPI002381B13A|nr:hypothetical protein [Methylobacterium sp. 092160098-2]MDE4911311.1 hypothetical protein [Methylobacterium sp. 092160098-2]
MAAIWVTALVRALASGTVVVLASVLAELLGPVWGALIVSLPVSAGPAYLFMALEHDTDFVAGAALNGFAANAATGLFLTVYALRASGRDLGSTLGPATLAWLAVAIPVSAASWTPLTALGLNALVYGAGAVATRQAVRTSLVRSAVVARPRPVDLLARATAVALFVAVVLAVSSALGPARTGVVAAFPVTLTSTFVILHRRIGGGAMARLASIAIRGVFGFGLALLTLHLTVQALGAAAALCAALLVSLIYSAGLLILQRRPSPKEPGVVTR